MLLDWVTARAPLTLFSDSDLARLMALGDRIQRLDAATGAVVWETQAWDSIRSDSHHLSYRVGGDALWMQGSPARVIADGDAVIGAGPARATAWRDYFARASGSADARSGKGGDWVLVVDQGVWLIET